MSLIVTISLSVGGLEYIHIFPKRSFPHYWASQKEVSKQDPWQCSPSGGGVTTSQRMASGAPEAPAQESMWEPYIWLPLAFRKKAVGSFWMFQAGSIMFWAWLASLD